VYERGLVSLASRYVLYGILLAAAAGCQRWQLDSRVLTSPQPHRRQVEIWSQGHATVVHGVRLQGDTVVAVPYWMRLDCDSCAVRFARAAIDSVRVQAADNVRSTATLGAGVVVFVLLLWLYRGLWAYSD
jgi:hypothetical protein